MVDASLAAPNGKPTENREIYLSDYAPPDFGVEHISLVFRLFNDRAEVTAVCKFFRKNDQAIDLALDGSPFMELTEVALDGSVLAANQYIISDAGLSVRAVPDAFELRIKTTLKPHDNTRLEGLYFSGGNFCTQCEAQGFRHITYFPDRPDVLATYDVRLEAVKADFPLLLANGNPGLSGGLADGRHFAEWHDPHPKPCYLFALVAGDLACATSQFTTASGRDVTLNVYVEPGDVDKSAHALASLERSMTWDEERFGLEYDLDVYNIVAVADFNMGAMENKGLNIFNTKYVLASADTATDVDFDNVEAVIGHEYFHNWTGNRVTCRDWFQLSLKEGLTVFRDQEFSSDLGSRALKRLNDVRALRMLQFSEDAGPLAHPIRPEKYIEINNFYTSTIYNKGAEVIRMMHRLLGEVAFRRGMDLYFERHDGQAVTCEDFIVAMEDASGRSLKQFRLWYSQAGTPRVSVVRERNGSDVGLRIQQDCSPTPGQNSKKDFHMPFLIGWISSEGIPLCPPIETGGKWSNNDCLIEITRQDQTFVFKGVPEGAVVSLHRDFSCPVKLEDDLNAEEYAFLMAHDTDPFSRWEAAQRLASKVLLSTRNQVIKETFKRAFRATLRDKETDVALIGELLTLPSEIDLGQQSAVFDPLAIHQCRQDFIAELAYENAAELLARYTALSGIELYSLDQSQKAQRRLKNILLSYIAVLPGGEKLVVDQYSQANNMTDRMAALGLIASSDFECRLRILDGFYQQWQGNALVVDKWFAVQAMSSRTDTLERVKELTNHPAFFIQNPNRVRSLVSSFSMLNQVRFHEEGGEGYRFVSDMIIAIDVLNPQTAARMIAPIGRWARMQKDAGEHMQAALKFILSNNRISSDVRELCSKSLE